MPVQLVFKLAGSKGGLLQGRHGGGVSSAGGQGRAQLHVDPRLRPMVGMAGGALQRRDDVVEDRIVRGRRGPNSSARRRRARHVQRMIS